MAMKEKARHFHAGKLRKEIDGVEYVEVAESNGKVFIGPNGLVITPRKPKPHGGSKCCDGNSYRSVNIALVPAVVHRVVWEVFNGEIPPDMEIDHIDTCPSNNDLSNLRLATSKENSANPITRERVLRAVAVSIKKAMEAHKKPVIGLAPDGTCVGPFTTGRDAARFVGVSYKAISAALRGKSKTSAGYVWKEVAR
jgi:hypothetical protein